MDRQADRQAFVESFNAIFRAECLDAHWFTRFAESKHLIEEWRREYNVSRPHRALGEQIPSEFGSQELEKLTLALA